MRLEAWDSYHGAGYALRARVWLAPYDLGVSQTVALHTEPTGEHRIYELRLELERRAGDVSSWRKTNWQFLNLLRKQFLIWRTLSADHKEGYALRALGLTEDAPPP